MAKEKEHESTKRRGSEIVSRRTGAQDRKEPGGSQAQPGGGKRQSDRLPQRRGGAGNPPGFQQGLAYGGGKTQPFGRIHGARALQVAALSACLFVLAGCGGHRKPVAANPPEAPSPS